LHDYFSTDWSHLWLLENDQPNKIKINRERYLKYTVTNLNDLNEPFTTGVNTIEAQGVKFFLGNFMTEISTFTNPEQQSKISAHTQATILKNDAKIVDSDCYVYFITWVSKTREIAFLVGLARQDKD
jgi:hypothetical protein